MALRALWIGLTVVAFGLALPEVPYLVLVGAIVMAVGCALLVLDK